MNSRTRSEDRTHAPEAPVKGCAEYRLATQLTALRRRLQTEELDAEERGAIQERILEIEKALGV